MFNAESFITDRLRNMHASGIRRVFDLAAELENPTNLSIGQPDFDVPDSIQDAACSAIRKGFNRYTQTQGDSALRSSVIESLAKEFPSTLAQGEQLADDTELLITSGVSGALMLALLTCAGPGDEVLIPDPYFVMYKHLVTLTGATPVYVDTYPDFQLTLERIQKATTHRTKVLLFNSPSNPTGVVASEDICQQVAEFANEKNILLLSDEIYNEFCYQDFPTPAKYTANLLLTRGFSKTYAMTGWRLGYVVGPRAVIDQMTKLQQYSFVCAPSMAQVGGVAALDVDMSKFVENYKAKRDRVVEKLSPYYELTTPGGAFYAFPKVPEKLGLTGSAFVEKAIAKNLLIIPGSVFSQRNTHFRISYACGDQMLERGLDLLVDLAKGQ